MNIKQLLLLILLFTFSGCGTTRPTTNTTQVRPTSSSYSPPTGADLQSGVETPGRRRLMTAASVDGLTFTRTNTIVTDQANVPDLVMDTNGTLYLYFSGWEVGDRKNSIGLAISEDQGSTWNFHQVNLTGNGDMTHSGDPDVVLLENGTFRLYSTFNLPSSRNQGIYLSESTDGINFDVIGVAYQTTPPALDSNTYFANELWHMLTLSGVTVTSHHATSTDGLTFSDKELKEYKIGQEPMVMSNVIETETGFRLYAFGGNPQTIKSFTSIDGDIWTAESGTRLSLDPTSDLESEYVKDPAVIKLLDDTYLMVYVTQIP